MPLILPSEADYRQYYVENFSRAPLPFQTSSGTIPVFFEADGFDHAFFESSRRDGAKDLFSLTRAERMGDIGDMLLDSSLDRRAGWNKNKRKNDHTRCVTISDETDFVVVVRIRLTRRLTLKGKFVTCYVADNSIGKIRCSPKWDEDLCTKVLLEKVKGH